MDLIANNFTNNLSVATALTWGLFGLVVGLITHLIDPSNVRGGVLGTTFTGIIGALVGGFLANLVLGVSITGFNLVSIGIAVVGALIFSVVERFIFRDTGHIKTTSTKLR